MIHQLTGPVWVPQQGRYRLACTCGNWSWEHPSEYLWLRELAELHRDLVGLPPR